MSPMKKPDKRRRSRRSHVPPRHGATPAEPPHTEPPPAEPPPPHVATMLSLEAMGWHVTEILPDRDKPTLWRVEIKRFDGAVSIIVLDAADPDAALEELARYAAADAEDPR